MKFSAKKAMTVIGSSFLSLCATAPAFALSQTGSLGSLDTTLLTIRQDITGFWAYTITIFAIILAGAAWAFGEGGGAVKKLAPVVMGGALITGATQLIGTLFGGNGILIH
jgi:type IV secretory pathway VirB2 component (pilin)